MSNYRHIGNGLSLQDYKDPQWPYLTVEVWLLGGDAVERTALTDDEIHAMYSWCHDHLELTGYFARREAAMEAEIEASKKK
jgi:hypothetical protein